MKQEHQNLMGAEVRDAVTGLTGVVTAITYYLNGCVRVCVQPPSRENQVADTVEWCDVQQVERIGVGVRERMGLLRDRAPEPPADFPQLNVGGPQKDAPRP